MWLLNTTTFALTHAIGQIPPYAILSHTWSASELTFQDMETQPLPASTTSKPGYKKVHYFCSWAKSYGFEYGWIDSCCIDKKSSAELSEAINSMYAWYRDAALCLVYLEDVPALWTLGRVSRPGWEKVEAWTERFKQSRWFTRGWTLQELIAPKRRIFYAQDWAEISVRDLSTTEAKIDLIDLIARATSIPSTVLRNPSEMSRHCIAVRMSWAASRTTTRPEDGAYSLFGLFNVSLPILYGEGLGKAFARLQEEIMKSAFDQTLFAWRGPYASSGLLAHLPSDFANTPRLKAWPPENITPYSMTNIGLHITPCIVKTMEWPNPIGYNQQECVAVLRCSVGTNRGWGHLAIRLRHVEDAPIFINGRACMAFRRIECNTLEGRNPNEPYDYPDLLVLEDRHYGLVQMARSAKEKNTSEKDFEDFDAFEMGLPIPAGEIVRSVTNSE